MSTQLFKAKDMKSAINLVNESSIMYFSSLTLEDSKNDDYRFDSQFWNPWTDYSPEIYE